MLGLNRPYRRSEDAQGFSKVSLNPEIILIDKKPAVVEFKLPCSRIILCRAGRIIDNEHSLAIDGQVRHITRRFQGAGIPIRCHPTHGDAAADLHGTLAQ